MNSQVLHSKPQPKRYFNASDCTIDRRKMLLCWYSSKHVKHAFRRIMARVSFALELALNTSATTKLRLNSMDLPCDMGGCKVPKNEVPGHAQTYNVLYLTFQRLGVCLMLPYLLQWIVTVMLQTEKALSRAYKFSWAKLIAVLNTGKTTESKTGKSTAEQT